MNEVITLILGLGGIVGTLVAATLTQHLQSRSARAQRLFDLKVAAYSDAIEHVQVVDGGLDWLVDEPSVRSARVVEADPARLHLAMARLRLAASPDAFDRFHDVIAREKELWVPIVEDGDIANTRASRRDPNVARVAAAIDDFVVAAARDLGWGRGSLGRDVDLR